MSSLGVGFYGSRNAPTEGTFMYIRIVTFGINIPEEQYATLTETIAPIFAAWPGLVAKWWLRDSAAGVYGGVYLFEDRAAADLSRTTQLFADMAGNAAFRGLEICEYNVFAEASRITAPTMVDQ